MCLIIDDKHIVWKKAEEDITVYKTLTFLSGKYCTPFICIPVPYNVVKGKVLFVAKTLDGNNVTKVWLKKVYKNKKTVSSGLIHTFVDYDSAYASAKYWGDSLFECVIPKGTIYIEGTFDDEEPSYASTKIRFVKKLI